MDSKDTGTIELYDFDRICLKFKINFTKEELKKIAKNYRAEVLDETPYSNIIESGLNYGSTTINYRVLSQQLGLHKDSLNFMSTSMGKQCRRQTSILSGNNAANSQFIQGGG